MASRRIPQPPPIEPKVFKSVEEINAGIAKLQRRIQDLEQLASQATPHNDQRVNNVESHIKSTIREVFGSNSPEFDEHQYHEIWYGPHIMDEPDHVYQQHFYDGIPQSKVMLEGLISRL